MGGDLPEQAEKEGDAAGEVTPQAEKETQKAAET